MQPSGATEEALADGVFGVVAGTPRNTKADGQVGGPPVQQQNGRLARRASDSRRRVLCDSKATASSAYERWGRGTQGGPRTGVVQGAIEAEGAGRRVHVRGQRLWPYVCIYPSRMDDGWVLPAVVGGRGRAR